MKPDGVRKKYPAPEKVFPAPEIFYPELFYISAPPKRMSRIRFEHLKTRKRRAAAYAVSRCCARLVK